MKTPLHLSYHLAQVGILQLVFKGGTKPIPADYYVCVCPVEVLFPVFSTVSTVLDVISITLFKDWMNSSGQSVHESLDSQTSRTLGQSIRIVPLQVLVFVEDMKKLKENVVYACDLPSQQSKSKKPWV